MIGREKERAILDKLLLSEEAVFLTVYGRRRIGKTFLIREYLRNHTVFHLTGERDGSLENQMANFFEEYLVRTKGKKETTPPGDWKKAFQYLTAYLQGLKAGNKKFVVFLDEMPWMDTPKSGFVSALEYFWNQHGEKMSNIMLVACGSATSWLVKNLFQNKNGLHNRITHRIHLHPFNLLESLKFLESRKIDIGLQGVLELYMAVGGVPYYLKEMEKGKTVSQIIQAACFSKSGNLHNEYEQLYGALFRNAKHHLAVVALLSKHHYGLTYSEILKKTKVPAASLSRTLNELVQCDFVLEIQPLEKLKRDSIFRLVDQYSLFYNRFKKDIQAKVKFTSIIGKASYHSWCGYAFENVCLMHSPQTVRALGIWGIQTSLHTWRKSATEIHPACQIDMLIKRGDNSVHLFEIKYSSSLLKWSKEEAEKLNRRKSILKNYLPAKTQVFSTVLSNLPKEYLPNTLVDQVLDLECLFAKE